MNASIQGFIGPNKNGRKCTIPFLIGINRWIAIGLKSMKGRHKTAIPTPIISVWRHYLMWHVEQLCEAPSILVCHFPEKTVTFGSLGIFKSHHQKYRRTRP